MWRRGRGSEDIVNRPTHLLFALVSLAASCATYEEERPARRCGGEAPTSWYLNTLAPTLARPLQHPDRLPPAGPGSPLSQGHIATDLFTPYTDESLECWADEGDRLAAMAVAHRIGEASRQYGRMMPDAPRRRILRYLEMATSGSCGRSRTPFCDGVPDAMFRLTFARGISDARQLRLLRRAQQLGVTDAHRYLTGSDSSAMDGGLGPALTVPEPEAPPDNR